MTATMDGYDPMGYLPSPLPYGNNMQHLDYMSAPSVVDPLDQYSNFDSEAYMSGDEMSFPHSTGLSHPGLMKRMSSGFEDPFNDGGLSQFDQVPGEGVPDTSSMDRDSKYLSFSMPSFPYRLYNDSFQPCYVNIQAQLHGMFFLAESQWPTSADTAPPPPELTCYRRNLFQITGSVQLPRSLRYIFTEDGQRIPIYELELSISATESVEGNPVKIISVPWKTPTGGEVAKPEDKVEREPPTVPLDKLAGSDLESDFQNIPVQWKRLQFRIATANNGRRKELQQHFTLHLKVMATVSTGEKFSIAESHSGAVIVRGRSPRNFAARKDLPLSSSSTSRKHVPSISRAPTSQPSVPQVTSAPKQQSPHEDVPRSFPQYDSGDMSKPEADVTVTNWQQQASPIAYSMSMDNANQIAFAGAPTPDMNSFSFAFTPNEIPNTSGPLSLHFESGDEMSSPVPQQKQQQQPSRPSSRPPTSNPSPSLLNKPRDQSHSVSPSMGQEPARQRPRLMSHQPSVTSVPSLSSIPSTTATTSNIGTPIGMPMMSSSIEKPLLVQAGPGTPFSPSMNSMGGFYEYLPLSVEEWQPPVDAVFRPHVVHHSGPLHIDTRSPPVRSKRYFSEVA